MKHSWTAKNENVTGLILFSYSCMHSPPPLSTRSDAVLYQYIILRSSAYPWSAQFGLIRGFTSVLIFVLIFSLWSSHVSFCRVAFLQNLNLTWKQSSSYPNQFQPLSAFVAYLMPSNFTQHCSFDASWSQWHRPTLCFDYLRCGWSCFRAVLKAVLQEVVTNFAVLNEEAGGVLAVFRGWIEFCQMSPQRRYLQR